MIGSTISHYRIVEKLGAGGMGVVYRAEDTQLKRTVALKFLPPALTCDPEAKARFSHEAQAASALDHPHICTIHDVGETEDGQMFIVMACYEGVSLKSTIENRELRIEKSIDIAIQIAEGLARAHEAGIVHRDIKPANIFITTHNEVKILDFGLAKLTGQTIVTKMGSTLGTAAYMSPEQARGEVVDQRTDIWSLGIVLYEMLTGHRPFASDYEQALIYEILNEEVKPPRTLNPEIPEVVEQVVLKALEKDSGSRYQTAADLLSDLRTVRASAREGVTLAAVEAAGRRKRKRRAQTLIVAGTTLMVLAGLFLFLGLPLLHDEAIASNPRAVAFVSFENNTGDSSLAYLHSVLPQNLVSTLEDSKYLRVTPSDRIREMMKQIGKDSVEFVDRATGLQLCRRARIDVMGAGRFTRAGQLYQAELELVDVSTGQRLGSVLKARGRGQESFLEPKGIVEDLARQVSEGLGVSTLRSQTSVRPVAEVSSTSLEAQRYFQRGKLEFDRFNFKESRHYFELAVKEDSTFASGWFGLAIACAELADGPATRTAFDSARKNAGRASEREQFAIARWDSSLRVSLMKSKGLSTDRETFFKARTDIFPFDADFVCEYAIYLRGNGRNLQAIAQFEKALKLDPSSAGACRELGYSYAFLGQGDKAIECMRRYAELQPGDSDPYESLSECLMFFGKYDESLASAEKAVEVKPDNQGGPLQVAKVHFMREEYDEAMKWATRESETAVNPSYAAYGVWWRAWFLIWTGRLKEAEEALAKAEQMTSPTFDEWMRARIDWLKGWCAFERRDWKAARLLFWNSASLTARSGVTRWYAQFCLGLLDIQQGLVDSARIRLQQMRDTVQAWSRQSPVDSSFIRRFWIEYGNALRASILLAEGHPEEITPDWYTSTTPFYVIPDSTVTLNWPRTEPSSGLVSQCFWVPLPFDIMPQSYVARGMIDNAIISYEQALKKPPYFLGPIVPRYYYRVARLYEQKGMKEKAIENYTQFLKVWEKADPVYKEPGDARKRLARLKSTK